MADRVRSRLSPILAVRLCCFKVLILPVAFKREAPLISLFVHLSLTQRCFHPPLPLTVFDKHSDFEQRTRNSSVNISEYLSAY